METHLKEIQRLAFELMAVVTSACEMADRKTEYDSTEPADDPAPVDAEAELTEKEQAEEEESRAARLRSGVS